MGFVTIEDLQGAVEATVFSRLYGNVAELLTEDSALLVQGEVQRDEQSVKLIAETIVPLAKAEETWTSSVHVHLDVGRADRATLLNLKDILDKYPGACKVFLHLRGAGRTEAKIELATGVHLKAGAALRREVTEVLGYPGLETRCTPV
jgi:DNA polymerase-3 subunit alpha